MIRELVIAHHQPARQQLAVAAQPMQDTAAQRVQADRLPRGGPADFSTTASGRPRWARRTARVKPATPVGGQDLHVSTMPPATAGAGVEPAR